MPVRIGELLLKERRITAEQLQEALNYQGIHGGRLAANLVTLGFVTDAEITALLSKQYGVPAINLAEFEIDPVVIKVVPAETAHKYRLIPISRAGARLTLAMADPTNVFAMDDVKFQTGYNTEPVLASETAIADALAKYYPGAPRPAAQHARALEMASKALDDARREMAGMALESAGKIQRDDEQPVQIALSAPRAAAPGESIAVRFVAYAHGREQALREQLAALDPSGAGARARQISTALTPTGASRWRTGAPVTVCVYGTHFRTTPSSQSFEWNGESNLLSFLVEVAGDAPLAPAHLSFEAFIEGVPVFFMPAVIDIARHAPNPGALALTGLAASSAFASYSSRDDQAVKRCLSALKRWDPRIDVFVDCLDLQPNEAWQRQLERVIPSKDTFLLFWSVNAMKSKWVAWEIDVAESTRGLDFIRPMPLDAPDVAPPPEKLHHIHFGDRYLAASGRGASHGPRD